MKKTTIQTSIEAHTRTHTRVQTAGTQCALLMSNNSGQASTGARRVVSVLADCIMIYNTGCINHGWCHVPQTPSSSSAAAAAAAAAERSNQQSTKHTQGSGHKNSHAEASSHERTEGRERHHNQLNNVRLTTIIATAKFVRHYAASLNVARRFGRKTQRKFQLWVPPANLLFFTHSVTCAPIKWNLIRSNGFSRAHECDRRTDGQTTLR